ncbi:hypothetical protein RHA1_ro11092 (plasmid) [Rhodococcus jostii RHA1]|uniref:Uncharacterized protein n=1 Tax=Rhodococcus jostii (strain RHA1) TaxID=101510 RepID=Q0RVE7_RHOJR|nr:hypothetical protein RHA1_ro11092 [Rhodococcus jostii RHA1]
MTRPWGWVRAWQAVNLGHSRLPRLRRLRVGFESGVRGKLLAYNLTPDAPPATGRRLPMTTAPRSAIRLRELDRMVEDAEFTRARNDLERAFPRTTVPEVSEHKRRELLIPDSVRLPPSSRQRSAVRQQTPGAVIVAEGRLHRGAEPDRHRGALEHRRGSAVGRRITFRGPDPTLESARSSC